MSFDPFDAPNWESDFGETRGMAVHALAAGASFIGLSVFLVATLALIAPGNLAPLGVDDHEMRRFANTGHFPLIAAAVASNMTSLAFVASAQTFLFFVLLAAVAAYFGRRGYCSERVRGWTNIVWIMGVLVICLFPSFFPELTAQRLDYAITASWSGDATPVDAIYGEQGLNRHMLPTIFIFERGVFGALFAASFAFVMHDLGYRLREALEDFGLIDAEEARRPGGAAQDDFRRYASSADTHTEREPAGGDFGQRGAPPREPATGPRAQARIVLGVSAMATRRDIERAYRAQMKRAHPDHGGSVESAAALNAARDTLLGRG